MLDTTILAKVSGIRVSGRSVSAKNPFICVKHGWTSLTSGHIYGVWRERRPLVLLTLTLLV